MSNKPYYANQLFIDRATNNAQLSSDIYRTILSMQLTLDYDGLRYEYDIQPIIPLIKQRKFNRLDQIRHNKYPVAYNWNPMVRRRNNNSG